MVLQKEAPLSVMDEREPNYTWMPGIAEIEELREAAANGTAKRYKTVEDLFVDLDAKEDDD